MDWKSPLGNGEINKFSSKNSEVAQKLEILNKIIDNNNRIHINYFKNDKKEAGPGHLNLNS
jgi:hypothetical protein